MIPFIRINTVVNLLLFFITTFSVFNLEAQCPGNFNVDFTGDRCVGSEITFNNNSTGAVLNYEWTFEGGNIADQITATATGVKHTFNSPGNYNVKVIRRCGANTESRTINLNIVSPPQKPIITSNNSNDCGGDKQISFGIQNQVGGVNYNWNFGDPASGQENTQGGTNPNHKFSATGISANYQVKVTAVSNEGCKTDSDIKVESIKSTPKINVVDGDPDFNTGGNFTRCLIDGNSIDSIYTFTFDNQSNSDDPNTTYTFKWGDGTTDELVPTGSQATHKYETFGVSTLTIVAKNTVSGCQVIKKIEIVNEKFPSASLSIPPAQVNICDSTTVSIDNNSKNATSFKWYWGDADTTVTTSQGPIDYQFALNNAAACQVTSALGFQMKIRLEAFNSCFTHENSSPINVRPIPKASFTANTGMFLCFDAGKSTYDVSFTLSSCPSRTIAGFATTYKFEITDPNNPKNLTILPNQSNVIAHTFTAAGVYPLKMTATNSCGSDVVFDTLYIAEPAIAKFGNSENTTVSSSCTEIDLPNMSPVSNCGPFLLDLKNLSSNLLADDNVNWTVTPIGAVFGSSNASSSQSFEDNIAFDLGKTYTLTLAVSNQCNASNPSKACAIVKVKDIPKMDATKLAGFEDSDFKLTKGNPNVPPVAGDTLEYSRCDVSTLNTLFIDGLDDSTKTYQWNVKTIKGNTTGFSNPTDSLPGAITFDPGQYVLQVGLGNECGDTVSAPVKINVLEPEPVDAGGTVPVVTACKDTNFTGRAGVMKEIVKCSGEQFSLGKNAPKPGITYKWSTDGSFALDSIDKPNTTVTLLNNDSLGNETCQLVYAESDNGVCKKVDSVLLVVRSAPLVNIGVLDTTICKNTDAFVLNFSPKGGTWTAGSAGVVSAIGGIIPSKVPKGNYVLSYQFTDPAPQGCTLTLNKKIAVVDSTPVAISLATNYCESDIAFQATANPMGGVWTSDVATAITNTGMLTTSEIGKGNSASIFYVFIDNNNCISKDTAVVDIDVPVIPKTGLTDSICANGVNLQLTAITPSGIWIDTTGTFSLTSAGVFNPIGLTSGLYQVYYEINTGTPCVQRSLKDVFVKPLTAITIKEPIGPFCAQDNPSSISVSPQGGTWTAPNNSVIVSATDTVFAPKVAGQNLAGHTLTYAFTNSFNCTSTKTTSVIVQPLPAVIAGPDVTICQNTDDFQLTGFTPISGGNLAWSILNPSSNSITNDAKYNPSNLAKDTLIFRFSLPSLCFAQDTMIVTVVAPVDADAGLIDSLCVGDASYSLKSGITTPFDVTRGSQWTGFGVVANSNTMDLTKLTTAQLNVYNPYVYRYGVGNCETFDTTFIKVFSMPEITPPLVPNTALCEDAAKVVVSGYSAQTTGVTNFNPTFGAWTGAGISKSVNTYTFDPNVAGASNVPLSIFYTYIDSATAKCKSVYEHKVSVEPIPVPNVVIPELYCVNQLLNIPNTSTIAFGTLDSSFWSFTPVNSLKEAFSSNTKFTFPLSGVFDVTYRVVSTKGCDSSFSKQITIIDPPKANFTLSTNPVSSCGPVTALIQDNSTGFDSTYFWNFGLDLDTINTFLANDTSLTYTQGFITDTLYPITLIVQNQCAADTMVKSVRVLPSPNASFGTNKDIGCSPAEFVFNNNSFGYIDGQATSYNFSFSDGSPDAGPFTHRVINGKRFDLGPPPRKFVYNGFNDTTYTITMIAENSCGSDTAFHTIKVLPNDVKAFFNQNINQGCSPLVVNYIDFSSNSTFVSYDFGDGNSIVARNTSHTFVNNTSQILDFEVAQMVNNACSYDTVIQSVKVFPLPNAQFEIRANATCANDSILFDNTSNGINSSEWIFVNELDTIKNINSDIWYQFNGAGRQEIKLIVSESLHNCTDTTIKTIDISVVPETVLDADSVSACEPFVYTAIIPVNAPGDKFTWVDHFGDTISVFNAINYEYSSRGEYVMTLITESINGCVDVDSIVVEVFPSPQVSFDITKPIDLCVFPKLYNFNSTSSADVQQFEWFLDGQKIDSINKTEHLFLNPDTVEIALFAKNNFNCFNTKSKELVITPLPKADFNAIDTEGCEPFVSQFKNNSSNASTFAWTFGDGTDNDRIASNHLYTDGVYDIRLIATNVEGCRDTLRRDDYIVVLNKPEADFEYIADTDVKKYGKIDFRSTSLYSTFYTWNFEGDIESTDSIEISHTFDFYGLKTVNMIAFNENNCSDTVSKVIRVPFFGGLYVPNAFVPSSGDPKLCRFKPVGFGLKEYKCQIFDTWGNLIWESTAINEDGQPADGWDGKFKGEDLPENAYVWKIQAVFVDGIEWEGMQYEGDNKKRKVGSVTVLR